MKRLITYLACATLVAAGGNAFQKVTKDELHSQNLTSEMRLTKMQSTKSTTTEAAGEAHISAMAKERAEKMMADNGVANVQSSNSVKPKSVSTKAVAAPYVCTFDTEADFTNNWVTVDGNGDGRTWAYDNYYINGAARCGYSRSGQADDWLITAQPVTLTAGDAYIAFDYGTHGSSGVFVENLEVLYGTSSDTGSMQRLVAYEGIAVGYNPLTSATINFTTDADGDYYFAFRCYSAYDQYGVYVDNVEVNNGSFAGTPDLTITDLALPTPSPSLGADERIVVSVANQGSGGVDSYALSYVAECNGTSQISSLQTITEPLAAGASASIVLDMPVNMLPKGVYNVTVTVSDVVPAEGQNEEVVTDNNSATAQTTSFDTTDVPFITDFSDGEKPEQWASDGSWGYESMYGAMVCTGATPLYSQGVNLEGGKLYKINYTYQAGYTYYWFSMSDDYDILCGPAGGELQNIYHNSEYTNYTFVSNEVIYACPETGTYQFAFSQDYINGSFYVKAVSITEVPDNDIAVDGTFKMPTIIPASQNGEVHGEVVIANNGAKAVSGSITLVADGATLATVDIPEVASLSSASVPVTFSLASYAVGSTASIEATASISDAEDAIPDDNSATFTIAVTEDELAYDHMTADMYSEEYSVGIGGGSFVAGIPIHLVTDDVLTGISAGWAAPSDITPMGSTVAFYIYRYDPEVLDADGNLVMGDLIYFGTADQGSDPGQVRYEISPRALEAGDYMLCVGCPQYILCDLQAPGLLYLVYDGTTAVDQATAALGTVAIRGIFGDKESAVTDLQVNEISSPVPVSVFASNEPITVRVTNNGSAAASATLTVTVNGEAVETQAVELAPYQISTYTFTADLSTPGDYTIVATAEIAGDENPDDNSMTKVVTCLPPADPYVMDFEYCEDFATTGFTPEWTTYDGDGDLTYAFNNVTFPGAYGAFAFIAFNPYNTTPSLADIYSAAEPHGGSRFGASLCSLSGRNDDWLISPKLTMPVENANVSMYVQGYWNYVETFEVLVSTTDNNPESFEVVYEETEVPSMIMDESDSYPVAANWGYVDVDLSAYNGQDIYIAIRCTSPDQFMFMVDDIVVSKPMSGISDKVSNAKLALYPNPATDMIVISAAGEEISSAAIYSASGALVGTAQSASGEIRYNVSGLAQGVYFAKVDTEAGTQVIKFVKK